MQKSSFYFSNTEIAHYLSYQYVQATALCCSISILDNLSLITLMLKWMSNPNPWTTDAPITLEVTVILQLVTNPLYAPSHPSSRCPVVPDAHSDQKEA